jgi:hypothetical protein
MFVTFSCPVYAGITTFGDVAVQLLRLMGQSGAIPGALLAEDVSAPLKRLEAGVVPFEAPPEGAAEDDNAEQVVSPQDRGFPLIKLLRAAEQAEVDVMWDKHT